MKTQMTIPKVSSARRIRWIGRSADDGKMKSAAGAHDERLCRLSLSIVFGEADPPHRR